MVRKGTCPVLTERHDGEKQKHNFIPQRPRCPNCSKQHFSSEYTLRCSGEHKNYGRCNGCGLEDRELHFCDATVSESGFNFTRFFSCSKRAKERRTTMTDLIENDLPGDWWLCKQHLPENVLESKRKKAERGEERYKAQMAQSKYGWVGKPYERLLLDMTKWMAANAELVAEDEWLGQIAAQMTDNTDLMEALEQEES